MIYLYALAAWGCLATISEMGTAVSGDQDVPRADLDDAQPLRANVCLGQASAEQVVVHPGL